MNSIFLIPNFSSATGLQAHCNHHRCANHEDHNCLCDKEPFQLVRRCQQDRELDRPEDEVGEELLAGNSCALGQVIRQIQVRWPNGTDDLSHGSRTGVCLNSMPKERGRHPRHHSEAR